MILHFYHILISVKSKYIYKHMAWHAFKKLGNDIEHSYFSENKMFKKFNYIR